MKTSLEKVISQIGLGMVLKSIPAGYTIHNCELHGRYMSAPNTKVSCSLCPATPPANGTDASTVEHYIQIDPAHNLGTNPNQKINPYGI